MDYTTLFYVPKKAPFDLYYADYKPGVKLYVKRVFITDDDKELMPVYLRFVRGVDRLRGPAAEREPRDTAAEQRSCAKIKTGLREEAPRRVREARRGQGEIR